MLSVIWILLVIIDMWYLLRLELQATVPCHKTVDCPGWRRVAYPLSSPHARHAKLCLTFLGELGYYHIWHGDWLDQHTCIKVT